MRTIIFTMLVVLIGCVLTLWVMQVSVDQKFVELSTYHQKIDRMTLDRAEAAHKVCQHLERYTVQVDTTGYSFCIDWGYDI